MKPVPRFASHQTQPKRNSCRVIFVTGTDTGVGKTLLTAMLLQHLRESGVKAHATKPFCSGGTGDVELLSAVQDGELSGPEVNPFYFDEPLAPLVAERIHHRTVPLQAVVSHIRTLSRGCEVLLVEGSGGLLVPLGEGFSVADLIRALICEVLVVAQNRLGTINHTLLTVRHLQSAEIHRSRALRAVKVVLMDGSGKDVSCRTNRSLLAELLAPVPVFQVPFLGRNACSAKSVKNNRKKITKTLASISE